MVECLEKHLDALKSRQAQFKEAHPELGPMELRRSYWEVVCRRQRISNKQRRRIAERKELNAFIRLVKEESKKPGFWE
jgi:hypothetical protein